MRRMFSILPRTFFCAMVVLLFAAAAQAQFKANLQGTVTDPAGGVVQGATVTLTSNETQRTQTVTTNDEGFYRFSSLPPGAYTVTAEQTGFNRAVVENFAIAAEETQGLDLTLTTGQITESVTITDTNSTALQTENANVSGVVTTAEVRNLPQVGRDPYELLRLTPGILGTGARSGGGASVGFPNSPGDDGNVAGPGGSNSSVFQSENQVPISANGQRISNNNFQIDGVSVNSLQFGGAAVVTPNQESVKEVRVTSSTYSAEQGRNSGAQVEVVSQNGTNDFHGSAFFKYNDPALNAFNKYGGINTPPQ
ncbi:MAG: carboxypeptidase regulatory-like domain-containing protein, partial [Pyrinomonadaceae bacterium]|nr:carboxypeptidase regulatory-like domain-containing protein [Pyrinomonadaceae bacterium]